MFQNLSATDLGNAFGHIYTIIYDKDRYLKTVTWYCFLDVFFIKKIFYNSIINILMPRCNMIFYSEVSKCTMFYNKA